VLACSQVNSLHYHFGFGSHMLLPAGLCSMFHDYAVVLTRSPLQLPSHKRPAVRDAMWLVCLRPHTHPACSSSGS
jgi:hypothetical protein